MGWRQLERPGQRDRRLLQSQSPVSDLAVDGSGNLYAGGSFGIAGGKLSSYIARWTTADSRAIAGPGSYTFYTDNLPVTVVVPPDGQADLARINIQRFDKSYDNAPAPLQTGYFWDIEGLNAAARPPRATPWT